MPSGGSQKTIYAAAFVLMCLGLAYLVFSGAQENNMYFLNVSEALAKPPQQVQEARLFGKVASRGSLEENSSGQAEFLLVDKEKSGKRIRIEYSGLIPDSVEPGSEVIVEGSMEKGGEVFSAHTLLTQCPSKYESKPE